MLLNLTNNGKQRVHNHDLLEQYKAKADLLNLEGVKRKLFLENPNYWTKENLERVEKLYRNFLTLHALYPNETLVPTKEIDEFWHQHILDTKNYFQDCVHMFGEYLHHDPYFGINSKEDKLHNKECFQWTCILWKQVFNEPLIGEANPCASTDCR